MRDETVVSVPARAAEYAETARATAPPPRVAEDHGPRRSERRAYAALDLGTNNCRLLIAEPAPYGFRVIDAFSRIVRLGEGLGAPTA